MAPPKPVSRNGNFHHPYTPYGVQLEFMKTAYAVLEQGEGQIGILESPTGTGKSLSLICASMTWLRNHQRKQLTATMRAGKASLDKDEPQWIIDQLLERQRKGLLAQWEERQTRLAKVRATERALEQRGAKRRRLDHDDSRPSRAQAEDEEAEFLLDDWTDDGLGAAGGNETTVSKKTADLLAKVGMVTKVADEDAGDVMESQVKIYYASRTHSQLTQFISELRKPTFQSSLPDGLLVERDEIVNAEQVRQIPLASRQNLCINSAVTKLKSLAAINDRCAELQKPKAKDKCPFMPKPDNLAQTNGFRDAALAILPDIEDLHDLGKKHQICPYYASRTALLSAEVITLPYPLLLQPSAREALGIDLTGSVVIIDEAHNIMDAIANVNAAEIKLTELQRARALLAFYFKRFGSKLKGENRVMVAQVVKVLNALSKCLVARCADGPAEGIADAKRLLLHNGADQINLFKLIKYIHESKLAFKVESYASHIEAISQSTTQTLVLHTFVSFIAALTNLRNEGRIFYKKLIEPGKPDDIKLSYLLLSPVHAFESIAKAARAVLLAGGTMAPFEDYSTQLFPYLQEHKITTLSCGHVIASSNLCVWPLQAIGTGGWKGGLGYDGAFRFDFRHRGNRVMIADLGRVLLNICSIVPDGVVAFFPSYGYLDEVIKVWKEVASPTTKQSLWDRLSKVKEVLMDTKGASSDEILEAYSQAIIGGDDSKAKHPQIRSTSGALLLSVVGGKMSEGINFADRLGRCVVVVGLPYPNANSPEWKAKMEHIEGAAARQLVKSMGEALNITNPTDLPSAHMPVAKMHGKKVAKDFYENACMRAINQSIGRAIRHQNDYAAIVLIDDRYGTKRIQDKLPGWIRNNLNSSTGIGGLPTLERELQRFFDGKRQPNR